MKVYHLLSAGALLILNAACASSPGVSIVPRPGPAPETPRLPPPSVCLQEPATPTTAQIPTLPAEIQPPNADMPHDVAWWRAMSGYFERRATRAEIAQGAAMNVADEERRTRLENAEAAASCAEQLRSRDEAPIS
jgi:hypothetical protein